MPRKRSTISLLTAFTFVVLAVTGILVFALPFSIQVVGLHSLIGFVFVGLIVLHILNNTGHLSRYWYETVASVDFLEVEKTCRFAFYLGKPAVAV